MNPNTNCFEEDLLRNFAQNGVRRETVPNCPEVRTAPFALLRNFAQNGVRRETVPNCPEVRAAPFALFRNPSKRVRDRRERAKRIRVI